MTTAPQARPRRYLMCPPTHFEVGYAINPWMDVDTPVDAALALRQWEVLRQTYRGLGHDVQVLDPVPGLPDMVFAANGALVIGDRAYGARFRHVQRQAEAPAHRRLLQAVDAVRHVLEPVHHNEGEGDFLVVGDLVLAGTGFRTAPEAHTEAERLFGLPFISLTLVDPRYYHLDTAIAVLDERTIAYLPEAFSIGSQQVLRVLFPDAVVATAQDAAVLGLNVVSDGLNVVLPQAATTLAAQLRSRGYRTIGVDLSELLKAGGSVKCCTMEWHRPVAPLPAVHADLVVSLAGARPEGALT